MGGIIHHQRHNIRKMRKSSVGGFFTRVESKGTLTHRGISRANEENKETAAGVTPEGTIDWPASTTIEFGMGLLASCVCVWGMGLLARWVCVGHGPFGKMCGRVSWVFWQDVLGMSLRTQLFPGLLFPELIRWLPQAYKRAFPRLPWFFMLMERMLEVSKR